MRFDFDPLSRLWAPFLSHTSHSIHCGSDNAQTGLLHSGVCDLTIAMRVHSIGVTSCRRGARGRSESARRPRSTIGCVFRYAVATARAAADPTLALRGALARPRVTPRAAVTDLEPFTVSRKPAPTLCFDAVPEGMRYALSLANGWRAGARQPFWRHAWRISVPSTFRHSRMNAASAVQPLADTIVPST